MVLISSKKYACETCIKGHRSSGCKHTDRPLFEIKKKGRPVTQCEHCRELRKTKQVHVKCICEAKEPTSPPSTTPGAKPKKKGTPVIPVHAAFPHGVPPECATSSDSEQVQGGSALSASGCTCKAGIGDCHCCTPRTRPSKRRSPPPPTSSIPGAAPIAHLNNKSPSPILPSPTSSAPTQATTSSAPHSPPIHPPPTANARGQSHHILARIAELRPVLPRLSARDAALQAQAGGQHDLFHGHGHGHHAPHHHPDHFSPYGRAYDHALYGHEGGGPGGFYQQDSAAHSLESLLSVASVMSASSHLSGRSGHGHGQRDNNACGVASQSRKATKSPTEGQSASSGIKPQGHAPRSASLDGQPGSFVGFFAQDVEWRLPPSLSRAGTADVSSYRYPRSEPSFPLNEDLVRADADDDAVARTPDVRARSEDGAGNVDLALPSPPPGGVRTCGCGDGCACPGCALHDIPAAPPGTGGSAGGRHCADAACGSACLDCSILELDDFSAVVGFTRSGVTPKREEGEPAAFDGELRLDAGYGNNNLDLDIDLDLDLDLDPESQPDLVYGPVRPETYEQIDEWIKALPPGAFDFESMGTGASAGADAAVFGTGGGDSAAMPAGPPTIGTVQMFDGDVDAAVIDDEGERRLTVHGLTGGSPDPMFLGGSFLIVPGPDAHRRSRSSSSASSQVSSALGAGAVAGGVAGLSLEQPGPAPGSAPAPAHGRNVRDAPAHRFDAEAMDVDVEMGVPVRRGADMGVRMALDPVLALFPPPPDNERMLFY